MRPWPNDYLIDLLLYGSKAYIDITNELIITESILFICKSERFKVLEAFAWFFPLTIAWHLPPGPWRQALWTSCAPYVCLSNVMYKCFFSHLWVCDGDPAVSSRMPVPITQQSSCTLFLSFFLIIQKKTYPVLKKYCVHRWSHLGLMQYSKDTA